MFVECIYHKCPYCEYVRPDGTCFLGVKKVASVCLLFEQRGGHTKEEDVEGQATMFDSLMD